MPGGFVCSMKSMAKMQGVHPKLVACVKLAMSKYSEVDFYVNEGVRTVQEEAAHVANGTSKTMNSKHLIQADGFGHAVDCLPFPFDGNWNDPQLLVKLQKIDDAMQAAALELDIGVGYGGDWHSFKDYDHWQLDSL